MNSLDIYKIRTSMGLTQQQFGDLIGVNKRTIINYEQGSDIPKHRVDLINKIVESSSMDSNSSLEEPKAKYKKLESQYSLAEKLSTEIEFLKNNIELMKELLAAKTKNSELFEKKCNEQEEIILKQKEEIEALNNKLKENNIA